MLVKLCVQCAKHKNTRLNTIVSSCIRQHEFSSFISLFLKLISYIAFPYLVLLLELFFFFFSFPDENKGRVMVSETTFQNSLSKLYAEGFPTIPFPM